MKILRIAAGVGILAMLAVSAALLLPPYFRNLEFQRFLDHMVAEEGRQEQPEEVLRVAVVGGAARLGAPVRADQVRIFRVPGRLEIEVRYAVRVDFPLYTVDLHFRPSAGAR